MVLQLSHPGKERTKGDFTTAADFYLDRAGKQLVVPDMLESKIHFKLNEDGTATVSKTLDAPSKPESVCRGYDGNPLRHHDQRR